MVLSTGYNRIRAAVFISGRGSNLKSLIKFSRTAKSPISIEFVISNNSEAKGLNYAKIYVKEIMNLINNNLINGCANITGGGLSDNIKRIIPDKLSANINLDQIKTFKIFNWLKSNGVSNAEMLKTFNCGVGFCIIIERKNLNKIDKFFSKEYKPYVIGKISEDKKKVILNGSINWLQ